MFIGRIDQLFSSSDGVDFSYFCKFDELKGVSAHPTGAIFPHIKDSCYQPTDSDADDIQSCDKAKEQ